MLSPHGMQRITKFAPPPYLPGEVERRAAMAYEDSEVERNNQQLTYDRSLFHYF